MMLCASHVCKILIILTMNLNRVNLMFLIFTSKSLDCFNQNLLKSWLGKENKIVYLGCKLERFWNTPKTSNKIIFFMSDGKTFFFSFFFFYIYNWGSFIVHFLGSKFLICVWQLFSDWGLFGHQIYALFWSINLIWHTTRIFLPDIVLCCAPIFKTIKKNILV